MPARTGELECVRQCSANSAERALLDPAGIRGDAMFLDVRFVVLIIACGLVLYLVRTRKGWAAPLGVMAAIAAVLTTILFLLPAHILVFR